jgi:hypothetical protein
MESQTANLFPPNTSWQADLVVSIWFLDQEEFWLACKSPGTPFITDLEPVVWIVKHGHVLSGDLVVLGTALDVEIMNRPSGMSHIYPSSEKKETNFAMPFPLPSAA